MSIADAFEIRNCIEKEERTNNNSHQERGYYERNRPAIIRTFGMHDDKKKYVSADAFEFWVAFISNS